MPNDPQSAFLEALRSSGLKPDPRPADPTEVLESGGQAPDKGSSHPSEASGITRANMWRHPDAHPIVLDFLLLQKYGPEWVEWEPETLEHHIPTDFSTPTVSDLNMSKIQACKTLHLVDSFWQRWEVFVWCAMSFNSVFPDFEVMQVPTVAQAMVAVDIANRIRSDVEFSLEVRTFLDTLHRYDGVLVPLPPLDFVSVDTHEIAVDVEAIKKRWPDVRASEKAPNGDTMEDEQLRRMLIANHFLEESRTRLRQQLRLISNV